MSADPAVNLGAFSNAYNVSYGTGTNSAITLTAIFNTSNLIWTGYISNSWDVATTANWNNSSTLTSYAGLITGNGGLVVSNSATQTLTGQSTFSGLHADRQLLQHAGSEHRRPTWRCGGNGPDCRDQRRAGACNFRNNWHWSRRSAWPKKQKACPLIFSHKRYVARFRPAHPAFGWAACFGSAGELARRPGSTQPIQTLRIFSQLRVYLTQMRVDKCQSHIENHHRYDQR